MATNDSTMTANQQILKRWRMHRNALLAVAGTLPESAAAWRPWDKGFSTLELLHHLSFTPDFFFAAIENREMKVPPVPATIAEACKLLAELTAEHEAVIAGYSESDLQRVVTIKALNVTEPSIEVLNRIIGHEAHHKGQLWMYTRMLNIEPPFYVDLAV